MQSIVVVVALFLAVLVSTEALKCYDSNNQETMCSSGAEYCTKTIIGSAITKGCDGTGTAISPKVCSVQGAKCALNAQSANFCCCTGDLCNSASTATFSMLTVFAAVAAVLAAKML